MYNVASSIAAAVRRRAALREFRLRAATQSRARTAIVQSCDDNYSQLLAITEPINRKYAQKYGYVFCSHLGNASRIPKTANFNRYYLIRELMSLSYLRWVLWLDADAIVIDHTIRLESITRKSEDKMLILCRGRRHSINNGVFFLNLRHPMAAAMIRYMIRICEMIPRKHRCRFSDQRHMNRWLLQRRTQTGEIPFLMRYSIEEANFNYGGDFIRHLPRADGTMEERADALSSMAQQILPQYDSHHDTLGQRDL